MYVRKVDSSGAFEALGIARVVEYDDFEYFAVAADTRVENKERHDDERKGETLTTALRNQ